MRSFDRLLVAAAIAVVPGLLTPAFAAGPAGGVPAALGRQAPSGAVIVAFRIHGNYRTSDAEVIRLTGVAIGDALTDETLRQIVERLRQSGSFEEVEAKERFQSLVDTTHAVLVVVVRERLVAPTVNPLVRPFKRAADQFMFLPILDYTEGYGFTYGGRASLVDWLGGGERISVPLTWGGDKRAALEIDRPFTGDHTSRIAGGAAVSTRKNPHFEIDDHRVETWMRAEHELVRRLTIGGRVGWSNVTFGGLGDRFASYGADVVLDTRAEPAFPRNAIVARAAWEALDLRSRADVIHRYELEGRGYIGLVGQSVLSVRALYEAADRTLPPYLQALLGGAGTLRGHRAGVYAGDNLATSSVELRVPLDSPLGLGRAGLTCFYDIGVVYAAGQTLRGARFHQGAGGGVFLTAPFVHFNLEAGYDLHGRTRVHFSTGFTF